MVISNSNMAKKLRLLFKDTDSLVYEIETENIYDDFSQNKQVFDFSNYSSRSKYYDDTNTLVFRKMKDEMSGVAIKKVVGLKTKMYSILLSDSYEYRKAKNVNKNVAVKIRHCLQEDVLLNKKGLRHSMNRI